MLELVGSGLVSVWLEMAGVQMKPVDALDVLTWQISPGLVVAPDPSPIGVTTVQQYLKGLSTTKLVPANLAANQGIWLQSGPMLMANHQGTVPLPAASLTKIATSLVALKTFGSEHRFQTLVGTTGKIDKGILHGDLIITSGGDPMFVWEEAIALGNTLNKMGIKQVKGNLVVTGNFMMNFMPNPQVAGTALKEAMNSGAWTRPAVYSYSLMPKGTPKPQVVITGTVKVETQPNPQQSLLVRHYSLPLKLIIREMNVYSNNEIAQRLADLVGGHAVVQATAAQVANVPPGEIQLINGSGLGVDNKISPRAACAMLMALQKAAFAQKITLADLFPTFGVDKRGTTHGRNMPNATIFKTGTLNSVSALAGVMPTRDRGLVWFAIINRGVGVTAFRSEQDKLLQSLLKQLQVSDVIPASITPHDAASKSLPKFGQGERNEVLFKG
ncbi:D-alanyl-D-alanine carboxypeptidase [Calothrix sp. 336/3]|uniref:D-alanyl-D-alanine carboxypeptidase n=1 Tax=Calothrix sp. 336/3 TaxID=1337936 RepID=UPI0004E3180C|nr:D-alanyl-D-alanine carboxypeptidase [Calothrix sp. 336/3]AKG21888.1 D-alanyl-D-alanine carboxypeptidase [Calothrix sp. 336/3]